MKRIVSLFLVIVLMMCTLLATNASAAVIDTAQTGYPGWYETYYSFMTSGRYHYMNNYYGTPTFMLHDLDFNGVPELIISNGVGAGSMNSNYYVYAIKNGQVINVGSMGNGGFFYHMNSSYKGLYGVDGRMGSYACYYVYMSNYKLVNKNVFGLQETYYYDEETDDYYYDSKLTVNNEKLYKAYKNATTDDETSIKGLRKPRYYLKEVNLRGSSKSHFISQFKYLAIPKITKFENKDGGVKITWNSVKGAEKYKLYRKTSSGWTAIATTTSTSYTHKTSTSGQTYTYTVKCVSADGKRATSQFISAGFKNKYIATPKITKFENKDREVKISWGSVKGAEKYRLYRKTSTGWKTVTTTSDTSYTHKMSSSGLTYTYTVRCMTADGKTHTSSFVSTGFKNTYTDTPQLRTIKNRSDGVRFVWYQVDGAAKYRVFRKTEGTGWKKVADVSAKKDYFLDKSAKKGVTYTYTVRCLSTDSKNYTSSYDKVGLTITKE